MFKNISTITIKTKVITVIFSGIFFITAAVLLLEYIDFSRRIRTENEKSFTEIEKVFNSSLENEFSFLSLTVMTIAENPQALKACAEKDRETLVDLYLEFNKILMKDYDIAQF